MNLQTYKPAKVISTVYAPITTKETSIKLFEGSDILISDETPINGLCKAYYNGVMVTVPVHFVRFN